MLQILRRHTIAFTNYYIVSFLNLRISNRRERDLVGVLRGDDVGVDGNVGAREEATERAELLIPASRGVRGRRGGEAPAPAELGRGEGDDAPVPSCRGGEGAEEGEAAAQGEGERGGRRRAAGEVGGGGEGRREAPRCFDRRHERGVGRRCEGRGDKGLEFDV